jgi:hypothetical protein
MKTLTFFLATIVCLGAAAQDTVVSGLACNLRAIRTEDRARLRELGRLARTAVRERLPLADGYAYRLDGKAIGLRDVGDWVGMERLCCPFLKFQVEATGETGDWWLRLTGPAGVKAFLDMEFKM